MNKIIIKPIWFFILFQISIIMTVCSPPPGGDGSSRNSSGNSSIGANEIILLLFVVIIAAIFIALNRGRKTPKFAAYVFFGLGLIALIIGFKFKEWGMEISRQMDAMEGAEEQVQKGEIIVFLIAVIFLITGGYYFYKSSSGKK